MPRTLLTIVFGRKASARLVENITEAYRSVPPRDRALMRFIEDPDLNASIVISSADAKYYGEEAVRFIWNYAKITDMAVYNEKMALGGRQWFPEPPSTKHLAKCYTAPYIQYSSRAPTYDHTFQYQPKTYLPEETRSLFEREYADHVGAAPIGFSRGRFIHVDDRTRIPSGR